MINWIKSLFVANGDMDMSGWFDQMEAESKPSVTKIEEPIKNISEPVFAMLNTWKQNPKRFKTYIQMDQESFCGITIHRDNYATFVVLDIVSNEKFSFGLYLGYEALKDIKSILYHFVPWFAAHRIYPVLDCKVSTKPTWMTQDELDFITETVQPYYLKRVERYKDIVESRIDRTRKAAELRSEIAKQKERDRLTGIYK